VNGIESRDPHWFVCILIFSLIDFLSLLPISGADYFDFVLSVCKPIPGSACLFWNPTQTICSQDYDRSGKKTVNTIICLFMWLFDPYRILHRQVCSGSEKPVG
jgi:hypothetical protein